MDATDLRRLRDDLETLHQAAGLGLPFDQTDVWLTLAMTPAGMFLALWALLAPATGFAVGLAPLLGLATAAAVRQIRNASAGGACREKAFDRWAVATVAVGLL